MYSFFSADNLQNYQFTNNIFFGIQFIKNNLSSIFYYRNEFEWIMCFTNDMSGDGGCWCDAVGFVHVSNGLGWLCDDPHRSNSLLFGKFHTHTPSYAAPCVVSVIFWKVSILDKKCIDVALSAAEVIASSSSAAAFPPSFSSQRHAYSVRSPLKMNFDNVYKQTLVLGIDFSPNSCNCTQIIRTVSPIRQKKWNFWSANHVQNFPSIGNSRARIQRTDGQTISVFDAFDKPNHSSFSIFFSLKLSKNY